MDNNIVELSDGQARVLEDLLLCATNWLSEYGEGLNKDERDTIEAIRIQLWGSPRESTP
jgi:hypothetical protein